MCKVKFCNGTSGSFEVKTGLKQGDALSPVLFNLVLEKVIKTMPMRQGIEILSNSKLLAYADDIVIIGNMRQEVSTKTNDSIKAVKKIVLEVNQEKTKYLVITRETRNNSDLVVENYTFQQDEDFKYFGANINQHNNMHNEINLRISATNTNKGNYALEKLFKSKLLFRRSKECLYSSFIRPVLSMVDY